MKKVVLGMLLMMATTSMFAQFKEGTKYAGASLSGLNLSISDRKDFAMGINGQAGYFIEDNIMLVGDAGLEISNNNLQRIHVGAKGRYYFVQNGIYVAAGLQYVHIRKNYNDIQITPEVGYCFYLNHYISVEPAVYYDMSLTNFEHKSEFGLKVGLGIYF